MNRRINQTQHQMMQPGFPMWQQPHVVPPVAGVPVSSVPYIFRLYGPVYGPETYAEWIDVLDTMTEYDEAHIYINTPGGDLFGAISLIHAMRRCKGVVRTIADGEVASAGTLILLNGDEIEVGPYAMFMAHDASSVESGKLSETRKSSKAISELLSQLYIDTYEGFLTEDEILHIIDGIDLYLSAEELGKRVAAKRASDAKEQTD